MTNPVPDHCVTVCYAPCRCGTVGHYDTLLRCSCGYEERLNHGSPEDESRALLYHRLASVEKALGIRFSRVTGSLASDEERQP